MIRHGSNWSVLWRRLSRFPRILGLALCAACLQLAVALEVRPQIGSTQGLVKKKLPSTVNSAARELCPTVSADGRTLYFTREVKDVEHQTIWCSERLSDGTWGPAVKMPSPLNNDTTTFLSAALPDNNTLLVGGSFGSVASRASANDYLSGAAGGGQPAGPQKSMTIEESMRLAKKLEEADKDAKKRGTPLTFEELKRIFGVSGVPEGVKKVTVV